MSLRVALLSFAAVAVSTFAAPARAQSCTVDGFDRTCSGDVWTYCDSNTNTIAELNCQDFFTDETDPNITCAPTPCNGSDCGTFDLDGCLGERNGTCLGASPYYTTDTADDDFAGAVLCSGTDACETTIVNGQLVDTCVANPGVGTCAPGDSARCEDSVAIICFANSTTALTTPMVMDCGALGLACEVDGGGLAYCAEDCGTNGYGRCDGDTAIICAGGAPIEDVCGAGETCIDDGFQVGCFDEQCGTGVGSCDGTTAIECFNGAVTDERDCLTLGQTCYQENPSLTPTCITFDEACGPTGQGLCLNAFEAVICQAGAVIDEVNCGDLQRVCAPLDGGGVGCVERSTGEGEGEDEDEDEDEDDDDEPPPSLLGCGAQGAAAPLLLLALLRRRRARR